MTIIRHRGFGYSFDDSACAACGGLCCRGNSGRVWIGPGDIERISVFLDFNTVDFMVRYACRLDGRKSLKERSAGNEFACIFLDDGKTCAIYPVRPEQCRRFPFWDYFRTRREELARQCPGVRLDGRE